MTAGPHHELVIHIDADGVVDVTVHCPHTGPDRPCASWRNNDDTESCICTCEACIDGEHADCDSGGIPDIGRKWCDARPVDECWYNHVVAASGCWQDMLHFEPAGVQARIPVKLDGYSWEEPIEVEAIAQPEVTP